MAISWKFPIRYKILVVLSVVVIAAVGFYLYLASRIFYEDKTLLIYELNQTNVRTLSADVETYLKKTLDKLKLLAVLVDNQNDSHFQEVLAAFGIGEEDFIKVAVAPVALDDFGKLVVSEEQVLKTWPQHLAAYGKDSAYLSVVRQNFPIPFDVAARSEAWVRNVTVPGKDNPPLMTVAIPVKREGLVTHVIYADVRLDAIQETLSRGGIARVSIVDSEGHALAHSESDQAIQELNLSEDPLVKAALGAKIRSEVRRFEEGDKSFIGAFYQVGLAGLVVVSKIEMGEAYSAARVLVRKSILYAALIITTAFLIALFFSHSLTEPIRQMLEATKKVAQGDFNRLIHVSSHDELAVLAASFNSMTINLKNSREQIEEYSHGLEKKVQERTEKLEAQNVAIKEAQEALVRTTRLASVGEVAGRAAHEVLNPLTSITSRLEKIQLQSLKADGDDMGLLREIINAWAKDLAVKGSQGLWHALMVPSKTRPGKNLLEEDLENLKALSKDLNARFEDHKKDIEFLLKESGRISKIVNGMRHLTRVSGERRSLPMHELLREVVATMEDVLRKRHIECTTQFCEAIPYVLGDHDELLQVFSNLIRNSMQAIEEAKKVDQPVGIPAKIWFTTECIEKEGMPRLLIRICDNGPGISQENFNMVFESSFTTKSVEEGTGLGLSIARRFIRALDGEIIVEKSTPGVETVFLIELPLWQEQA